MKILGIETSCDETAVCILDASGSDTQPVFKVLGNALFSQIKTHAQYGGVFPALAKREHALNLTPLLQKALEEAGLYKQTTHAKNHELEKELQTLLEREPGLFEAFIELFNQIQKPDIEAIAVTAGPGLEPALWVGINFALALGKAWNIPVYPTNHMAGHILSPLLSGESIEFPALAFLISGGHTELVEMNSWLSYKVIGKTRDDAVGEAFDKVARILDLPYPGGPEISKLAAEARAENIVSEFSLPRPMLKSPDLDFSFSGIKTAVLYTAKKCTPLSPEQKKSLALEFENAVTEVLITKVSKVLEQQEVKTLILGGGVIANTFIRESFIELNKKFPETKLLIPAKDLATDNAVMIAMAGYINIKNGQQPAQAIMAQGNMSL